MKTTEDRRALIQEVAEHLNINVSDCNDKKVATPRTEYQKECSKVVTLEEAIRKVGLKDGMTISFHHHFRKGDKVLPLVMEKIAEMGFKDIKIAASSLTDADTPLIDHIKNGVVTGISTSGMRGELAKAISHGLLKEPVVFRSHGTRGQEIVNGKLHIDVAFLGASSCDPLGNACGYSSSPNARLEIYPLLVLFTVVSLGLIGIPPTGGFISKWMIASGAIRDTKNPRDILLAQTAAKVMINSGYMKNGFSIQTGSGGASLAVVKYIRQYMIDNNIKASFALGGITAHMVKMHEEGLIDRLVDVQSFDKVAAESLRTDPMHKEVAANEYASAEEQGAATHFLDIVVLSALEVDVNFNVNVLVGSDGIIRGAIGGHPDTAADSALSVIVCPLLRGRIPCIVDHVTTLITPGENVDVVVTEYGVAVNPQRPELAAKLEASGIKLVTLEELRDRALRTIGTPDPLPFGDKVVGVVLNRHGQVQDVIRNIIE